MLLDFFIILLFFDLMFIFVIQNHFLIYIFILYVIYFVIEFSFYLHLFEIIINVFNFLIVNFDVTFILMPYPIKI
jgi:hypothetical protein